MSVILTCNAGSSNTKFAAFDAKTCERKGHAVTHSAAEVTEWICSIGTLDIAAIGHRVVHGRREFTKPTLIDDEVCDKLKSYIPLAPLHQPANLRLIEETRLLYPRVPQIACFDTAFHHTLPEIERLLPLPRWYYNQGIQRYGFHGLSYQHIANVLPNYTKASGKVIAAHLGSGSSACAMQHGKSVATTMGFSTLDGLMMSTRCGALDAGVVLHMLKEWEMKVEEVDRLLYLESGLLGVSGITGDMRQLMISDKQEAKTAVELYCYLAAKHIASLLPALQGLDALIFTGGIGEHQPQLCEKIVSSLRWIGDFEVHVIPADEEAVIADACHALLA